MHVSPASQPPLNSLPQLSFTAFLEESCSFSQLSYGLLQGLLLSAYLKMLLADPNDDELRQQVGAVYERYSHFMDADLQQRAVEYQGLLKHPDVANRNVTAMPKWEKRKSLLLRRMAEKEVSAVLP